MKGKLYGIGAGPGDPGLLTVKAVKTILGCDVIALPGVSGGDRTAYAIAEEYIKDKELLECGFSMEKDGDRRKAARRKAAENIAGTLSQGKNVGFITLGDPTIYSTYMYIHESILGMGFEAEIIPGVASFCAAAAALNTSLCAGGETLHIIPADADTDIDVLLRLPGNKVIMKSGAGLGPLLQKLKQRGLSGGVKIAERCSMRGQRIFESIEDYEQAEEAGYFTIVILKQDFKEEW